LEVKFSITGGQLLIERKLFTKAMLMNDEMIRTMIYGICQVNKAVNSPDILKNENWVTIDYNKADEVDIGLSAHELLEKLKRKYKDKIKGKITIKMMSFEAYFTMYDLNSYDNVIKI